MNSGTLDRGDSLAVLSGPLASQVLYMDNPGFRAYVQRFAPTSVSELALLVGTYRPGPMLMRVPEEVLARRAGSPAIHPTPGELAPTLDPLLADTYGLLVYQDQVHAALEAFAGIGPVDGVCVRRYFDAKRDTDYPLVSELLWPGVRERGYPPCTGDELYSFLMEWSRFTFPREAAVDHALRMCDSADYVAARH